MWSCKVCGDLILEWRKRGDKWEPLGIDLVLHACPPRLWRAFRRRKWRQANKRWELRDVQA